MKQTWGPVCLSLLACASIALCDTVAPVSETPVLATTTAPSSPVCAPKGLKEAWSITPAPTHRCVEPGVPNFGKLNNAIWRSGQPSREGYQRLASEGLKTVINLRVEFPEDKDRIPDEVSTSTFRSLTTTRRLKNRPNNSWRPCLTPPTGRSSSTARQARAERARCVRSSATRSTAGNTTRSCAK